MAHTRESSTGAAGHLTVMGMEFFQNNCLYGNFEIRMLVFCLVWINLLRTGRFFQKQMDRECLSLPSFSPVLSSSPITLSYPGVGRAFLPCMSWCSVFFPPALLRKTLTWGMPLLGLGILKMPEDASDLQQLYITREPEKMRSKMRSEKMTPLSSHVSKKVHEQWLKEKSRLLSSITLTKGLCVGLVCYV